MGRCTDVNGDVEYIAGETLITSALREAKNEIQRIERFLLEQGYVEHTPDGQRLTPSGVETAQWFIENDPVSEGRGPAHDY